MTQARHRLISLYKLRLSASTLTASAGFDREKARSLLQVPQDYVIGACWAIGYIGDPEDLPEGLKQRELAPRARKSISEFVFAKWGTPARL